MTAAISPSFSVDRQDGGVGIGLDDKKPVIAHQAEGRDGQIDAAFCFPPPRARLPTRPPAGIPPGDRVGR